MAFTDAEKAKIRHYLGYPSSIWRYVDTRLESAIDQAGSDPTNSTQPIVLDLLAKIEAALEDWTAAQQSAGVRTIDKDDVGFFNDKGQVLDGKAQVGRSLVGRLSIEMGTPIANDIFSARGYGGDGWFDWTPLGRASLGGMG